MCNVVKLLNTHWEHVCDVWELLTLTNKRERERERERERVAMQPLTYCSSAIVMVVTAGTVQDGVYQTAGVSCRMLVGLTCQPVLPKLCVEVLVTVHIQLSQHAKASCI